MERFVAAVVLGGVALVVGLWTATRFAAWSPPWLAGGALVVAGVAGLAGGIGWEVAWDDVEY